jgi:hypothetical protein
MLLQEIAFSCPCDKRTSPESFRGFLFNFSLFRRHQSKKGGGRKDVCRKTVHQRAELFHVTRRNQLRPLCVRLAFSTLWLQQVLLYV